MDLDPATDAFRQGAKALATSRGRPEIYHETITCAFMRLSKERLSQSKSDSAKSARQEAN